MNEAPSFLHPWLIIRENECEQGWSDYAEKCEKWKAMDNTWAPYREGEDKTVYLNWRQTFYLRWIDKLIERIFIMCS